MLVIQIQFHLALLKLTTPTGTPGTLCAINTETLHSIASHRTPSFRQKVCTVIVRTTSVLGGIDAVFISGTAVLGVKRTETTANSERRGCVEGSF